MSGSQETVSSTPPDLGQLADQLIKDFTNERAELAEKAAVEADRWDWVHYFRAYALQSRSEFQEAIGEYLKVYRIRPDFVAVYINLGNAYLSLKQYEKAIEWYDKHIALVKFSSHAVSYYNRGLALKALGELDAAATDFRVAIEEKPDFEPAYRGLIGIALDLKDTSRFDDSIDKYSKAFQAREDMPQQLAAAYSEFATRLADSGRFDDAERYLGKALEIAPEDPGVAINVGYVRHKENRLEEAKRYYEKALVSSENRAGAFYNLAGVAALLERMDDALKYLQEAVMLNPRFRQIAQQDDDFSRLKGEKAFQDLVRQSGS